MTARPIVAPDVGLLVAHGLGPAADPKADRALGALDRSRMQEARVVLLPSVASEMERKLRDLDSVFAILREVRARTLPRAGEPAVPDDLETILSEVRRRSPALVRFIELVEDRATERIRARPSLQWATLLADVFLAVVRARESVRMRVRGLRLEAIEVDPLPRELVPPSVPEVRGDDRKHLEGCLALARKEGTGVLFLVFESQLQGHKDEIEKAFPGVRITNPTYLESYLSQDASQWLPPGHAASPA